MSLAYEIYESMTDKQRVAYLWEENKRLEIENTRLRNAMEVAAEETITLGPMASRAGDVLRAALDGTDKPPCTTCTTCGGSRRVSTGIVWRRCPDCSPAVPENQP